MGKNILQHIYKPSKCLSAAEVRDYLSGKCSTEGRKRAESHLLDCPLCSDAVEGFEETTAANPMYHLPEDFSAFKKKLAPQEGGKVRRMAPQKVLLRAAAVVAILVVSYFAWLQPPSGDRLYSRFYTSYNNDIPLDLRGEAETPPLNPVFVEALGQYSKRQFSESLPLLEESLNAEPDNDAIRFFAGMAYLETKEYDKAEGYFDQLQNGSSAYALKAFWYLALTSLKQGNKEKAKSCLEKLISFGGYKEAEARELLGKL